jgi:prolyl oligopeptidase
VRQEDTQPSPDTPVVLYGYGGFGISLEPWYSSGVRTWLEMGGIYAQPALRGGGEFGEEWHKSGMLDRKQNVFDDFIAAAEWLIAKGYTSQAKLAISGVSNGGLLVGACMTQRPDLFGAAVPEVGVMDMLRFHLFTIGHAWKDEYGDPEKLEDFRNLLSYSPLHNLRPGVQYPATMVMTSDHDDRVVPGHSFKFAAQLQGVQCGPNPALIRIETDSGHGAGTPLWKTIARTADYYAFLIKALNFRSL